MISKVFVSSSTVMGVCLQLLLYEVVSVWGVDTGFSTEQLMSYQSVLNI